MDTTKVPPRSAATELAGLLDSPEIGRLIAELADTRWTGRPGYPLRAMVGVALAKSMYSIPTWTRTVALVREHAALREAIGGECPSVYAAYRFAAKLRAYSDLLDGCIARVLDRLRAERPDFGRDIAIDASDLRLRERAALPLEERPRAQALLRPGRELGTPLGGQHPQGRWLLRLQGPRRRLCPHGPPRRLAGRDGTCARIVLRHRAARRGEGSRLRRRDDGPRHGL